MLEVMSSSKFQQKRIGYLAAVQSFTIDTDVLMLATNSLKKVRPSSSPRGGGGGGGVLENILGGL